MTIGSAAAGRDRKAEAFQICRQGCLLSLASAGEDRHRPVSLPIVDAGDLPGDSGGRVHDRHALAGCALDGVDQEGKVGAAQDEGV